MPKGIISLRSLKRCLDCGMKKENWQSVCWNPMNQQYCIGNQQFKIFNKIFSARELIGVFIDELLKMVPSDILRDKESLNRVGVSVPAIFGYTSRHTIYDLLMKKFDGNANINVINEPTAAIMACQDEMLKDDDGIYAILDIGGGTTDIVLYEKSNVINLRIDAISVGAAFQPRLNDYGVRVTYFRGWKATPTRSWC